MSTPVREAYEDIRRIYRELWQYVCGTSPLRGYEEIQEELENAVFYLRRALFMLMEVVEDADED